MGHATHFLQRLDRVNDRQVELALALYRDDDLLKSVLSSVSLPDGCERLAVSLDHPTEGPFVVLTRGGRFVTCLAAGMHVDGLPVVTRERFDIAGARVARMRDELERIRQLSEAGIDGQVSRILKNLLTGGPRFCREDAALVARVQPLLALEFGSLLVHLNKRVRRDAPHVAALRFDRLPPAERSFVEAFGQAVWATAHLVPFIGTSEARALISAHFDDRLSGTGVATAQLTFDWGTLIHAHRALWTVARSSKDGLHFLRKLDKTSLDVQTRMFRELGLGAIAASSSKLRAEARKALSPTPPSPSRFTSAEQYIEYLMGLVAQQIDEAVLAAPDELIASQIERGRQFVAELSADAGQAVPELPDEDALAIMANLPVSWIGPEVVTHTTHILISLPWLARAPVEHLFLPRAWVSSLLPEPGVSETERWFKRYMTFRAAGRPHTHVRAEPKVSRNAPCPCGSGKKSKHCCAARAAAPVAAREG